MIDISVIIPVYKAEDYIAKCIESFINQTFDNFELILIDDGSPDKSGLICDEYAKIDNRIRVIHKANGGVSSARQAGVDAANGKYFIHADPDDWVEPNMLYELYLCAEVNNSDFVICDFFVDDISNNKTTYISQKPSELNSLALLEDLLTYLHGSCCNKLVKKSVFEKYGVKYPLTLSFCEDLYVNLSLLLNDIRISYKPSAYYHYVQGINNNSLVLNYSRNHYELDNQMKLLFLELFKNNDELRNLCAYKMDYLIVSRAFNSKVFSNKEFRCLFGDCSRNVLKYKPCSMPLKALLYFSCIGGYFISKKIYNLLLSIR